MKQWVSYIGCNLSSDIQPRNLTTPVHKPRVVKQPVPPTKQTQPQQASKQSLAAGRQPRQSNSSTQRMFPVRSRSCSSAKNYIGQIPTKLSVMDTLIIPPELLPEPQQIKPSTQEQPLQPKQMKQSYTKIQGIGVRSRSCCSSGNRRRNTFGTKDLYLNLGQALLQPTPKHIKHSLTKPTNTRPTKQLSQAQRTLKNIVQPKQQNIKKSSPEQLSRQFSGQSLPEKMTSNGNTRQSTPERPVRQQIVSEAHPQTRQSSPIQPVQLNNVKQALIQPALPHNVKQSSSSINSTHMNQARQTTHPQQTKLTSSTQQLTEQTLVLPTPPNTRHMSPKLTRLPSPIRPTHPQQPKMSTRTTRKVSRLSSPLRPITPRVTRLSSPVQPTHQQRTRLPSPTQSTNPKKPKQSSPARPTHPQVTVQPTNPQSRQSKQLKQMKRSDNSKGNSLSRPSSSSIYRQDSPQLTPSDCETIILEGSELTSTNVAKYRAIGTSYEEIQIPDQGNPVVASKVKEEVIFRKSVHPTRTPKIIENNKIQPASVIGYSNTKIPVSRNSPKPLKPSLISNRNLHVSSNDNSKEPQLHECILGDKFSPTMFENEIDTQNDVKSKLATSKFPPRPFRTTVMHTKIKDFKPQLEDIQSSYLLLNTQPQAAVSDVTTEGKKGPKSVTKPARFDEKSRVQLLQESKQKFKTKQFFTDSRYEKIEGLNWISW